MSAALTLAAQVARKVGMVPTWPNVQTIRLAIECEAEFSEVSLDEVAKMLVHSAREWSRAGNGYIPADGWEHREAFRNNVIDRFWFEDARWRSKQTYVDFRQQRSVA